MNKVTLFLMSEKGYNTLKSIVASFDSSIIECIIIGRDKNVQNDFSEKIIKLANAENIKIIERQEDYTVNTTYAISISWRWLIDLGEQKQLIVLHDSLLPTYRGFAPLVSQLINGEQLIGVTAIIASKEFDRGPVILQKEIGISYPIKVESAIQKLSKLYQDIVVEVLGKINKGIKLHAEPQNEEKATYSLWRDEDDYQINWTNDSNSIKRFIDAVGYPYHGAYTSIGGKGIRVLDVKVLDDVVVMNRVPGKVLFIKDGQPVVVCGKGLLIITEAVYNDDESIFSLKKIRTKFL